MSSRKVDYLIDDVRLSTENEDFSDFIGIKDEEILRFLNDAQARIQSRIVQKHPLVFLASKTFDVTRQQEEYSLPANVYMGNKITQVDYSSTSSDNDYYPLYPTYLRNRDKGAEGDPRQYIRHTGKILLKPVPQSSSGLLRITYVRKVPKLDLKRGSVSSVTLDTSGKTITALTLDVSTDTVDSTAFGKGTRLSVVNNEGIAQMQNIQYSAVSASTGVVTVDPSFVYETGETISVGDIVVVGPTSSTHSELDDMVERYLISYATLKILQRDSSSDINSQVGILTEMESEIVAAYSEISDDINEIPDIVSYDDQWDIF